MLQEERFNRILAELDSNGAVKSVKLAELLDVSESTVRRDINELDAKGRLKKVFGGAVRIGNVVSTFEEDVAAKSLYHRTEKEEIARYAAGLIEDGDMVYIDAGTTTERMIDYIENHSATYMTNGIVHARKLALRGFEVGIVSGSVKAKTLSIIGTRAVQSMASYNFTKCFMGTNGIDIKKGFTTPDLDEAMVKEEAVKLSKNVYVLADSSKFEKIFSVTFAKLKGSCIITDKLHNDLYREYAAIKEVD